MNDQFFLSRRLLSKTLQKMLISDMWRCDCNEGRYLEAWTGLMCSDTAGLELFENRLDVKAGQGI